MIVAVNGHYIVRCILVLTPAHDNTHGIYAQMHSAFRLYW